MLSYIFVVSGILIGGGGGGGAGPLATPMMPSLVTGTSRERVVPLFLFANFADED